MNQLFYLATRKDTPFATDLEWYINLFTEQNQTRIVSSPEQATAVVLFENYGHHDLAYGMKLLDCPFISRYFNKIFTINHNDVAWPLLRGCYTSLTKSQVDHLNYRAINYPSVYNWGVENALSTVPEKTPRYLGSFQGSFASHPIRSQLSRVLANHPDFLIVDTTAAWFAHSDQQKSSYIDSIQNSLFSLCPRGNSPSTYRLFESMALGRCPVIISDQWAAPLDIPWEQCSIVVAEKQIHNLEAILRSQTSEALSLGQRARELWLKYFHHQKKFSYYADQLRELTLVPLPEWSHSVERCRLHWQSYRFRKTVGFTLPRRLLRKLSRSISGYLGKQRG